MSTIDGATQLINYNLQMTGSEIIKTPLGDFKCKIIKPFRDGENLFKNSGVPNENLIMIDRKGYQLKFK